MTATVQRGSVTYTSASGTDPTPIVLSPAVPPDRSVLVFTHRNAGTDNRLARTQFYGVLAADGASISFHRHDASSAATVVIEWEVVEFAEGDAVVQRGVVDCTADPTDVTLSEVDTGRAIWLASFKTSELSDSTRQFQVELASGTNLRLDFSAAPSAGQAVVAWQVVEFAAGIASVQHATATVTAESTEAFAITPIGAIGSAFVGHSARRGNIVNRDKARAWLSAVDEITFDRNPTGSTLSLPVSFFVCELLDGSAVQHGQVTIADGAASPGTQTLSPAVDTSRAISFVANSWVQNEENANDGATEAASVGSSHLTRALSASEIVLTRGVTSKPIRAAWQVIEFAAGGGPGGNVYQESIALEGAASLAAAPTLAMAGAVTIAGSADATAAARQDHRGAVSVAGDAGAAVTARATFAGGIAVEATAAASLDGTARFTDAAALAASAALSVSAGAQAFSESIALAATPAFDAAGALHLSGFIALGASADLAAAGSLRVGESVAFSATLDASAAASLTMQEALAAAATAALALAAESSADNVIVRTVSLSGQRHLVVTLEGRRGRTIRLRGSLSN